ncbi:MAG: CDP-alcohol phosphatidyltransferase family protein [Candidatus Rokubacteria bacterium]|nr:CDP-alcohol phosphatidyltransferase family protein [Candidatus Rokubacteria bacterium]
MLVILPPGSAGGDVAPGTRIAGLPLLRRTVLAATRAGFRQILLHPAAVPADRSLLAGTIAATLAPDGRVSPPPLSRIVLLAAHVLPQAKWLRTLLDAPIEAERLCTDGSVAAVIETADPDLILAEAAGSHGAPALFASLGESFPAAGGPVTEEGRFILTAPQSVPRAETWLLRSLVKEAEGFMSRHVERRISLALTRRLAPTRITPNAMTLVSLAIGLLGAPFFLSATAAYQLTGALLLLIHSILDGCDGELARLKFQESRWGSLLDFWGDNVVYVALTACIAVGWSLAIQAAWPLLLGGVAVASALLTAGFVYRHTREETTIAGPLFPDGRRKRADWLPRMADMLVRRDFIYLVVLLSAAGKAKWFLALAAVGTPLFLCVLVLIARTEARRLERHA